MALALTLIPPIDDVLEQVIITFDFSDQIPCICPEPGVTIASVVSMTCAVAARSTGMDPTPSERLIGAPVVFDSPLTGRASMAVRQLAGDMIGGVTYVLRCVVATTDQQQLSLWVYAPCVTPS